MTRLEIITVKKLLLGYQSDWAICGGWAIDLFLGRQTREHKDIDIFIWRKDQLLMQDYLRRYNWTLNIAFDGKLSKWQIGDYLELPKHSIWCKNDDFDPNFIELLINESTLTHYQHRRDQTIQVPIKQIILKTFDGIPYLAPQIALLYKAQYPDNNDNQHDFEVSFIEMKKEQQRWLLECIRKLYGDGHKWLQNKH